MCIILRGVSIHNICKNIANKICHLMDCLIFISEQKEGHIVDKGHLFALREYEILSETSLCSD